MRDVAESAQYDRNTAVYVTNKTLMMKIVSAMPFVENVIRPNQSGTTLGWEMFRENRL